MNRPRKSGNHTPGNIAAEIRSELRYILRARRDLYSPLRQFEPISCLGEDTRYYVVFDMSPRKAFTGLKQSCKQLKLPDESIHDRILEFAMAVWHLKDRLEQYAKATKQSSDLNSIADNNVSLLVTADLANKKKHGRNKNRSKLDPQLDLVAFDTSRSGEIELYYHGPTRDKELIVTFFVPIPFSVNVLIHNGSAVATELGDAREVINKAFLAWLTVIQNLGILAADDPETKSLCTILFDADFNTE